MAMAGMHAEELGILLAGGLVADRVLVIDADRVFGVEVRDTAVLDEDARDAVAGRGNDKGVIEADLERAGTDLAVPIDLARAETEMPLADGAGAVAARLEHRGQRLA